MIKYIKAGTEFSSAGLTEVIKILALSGLELRASRLHCGHFVNSATEFYYQPLTSSPPPLIDQLDLSSISVVIVMMLAKSFQNLWADMWLVLSKDNSSSMYLRCL